MMEKSDCIGIAVALVAMVYVLIRVLINPNYMIGDEFKNARNQPTSALADEVSTEHTETPKTAQIQSETLHFECVSGAEVKEIETVVETEAETVESVNFPHYTVNGAKLDDDLYECIRVTLSSMNLSEYMPYVLCQMYQESCFDANAEATNGQDKGILQYRLRYWDWTNGDIFDPYAQLKIYLRTLKEKIDAGKSINEIISDHYTGGNYYCSWYVESVLQWLDKIEEVNQ